MVNFLDFLESVGATNMIFDETVTLKTYSLTTLLKKYLRYKLIQ